MRNVLNRLIKIDAQRLIFIFASFFLMAAISYFYISSLMRRQLSDRAGEALAVAEAVTRAVLIGAEANIMSASYVVGNMLAAGEPNGEILEYLARITKRMNDGGREAYGLTGVYAYVRGEFLDGLAARRERPLPPGFRPENQPWFAAAALAAPGRVAYTEPYLDPSGENFIITAVSRLAGEGESYGLLAVDLDLNAFIPRSGLVSQGGDTYNVIFDKNLTVIWHPQKDLIGGPLSDISGGHKKLRDMILAGLKIDDVKFVNSFGVQASVSIVKMYNGWYVGLVTPFGEYHKNIYSMLGLLIFLSLVFSFSLSYIMLRLHKDKLRSDVKNRNKSSFLARMSHEIRTPMGAVIGLSEIALKESSPEMVAAHLRSINQAGKNILALINDILDFSKVESGNIQLVEDNYQLAAMLRDAVAIISARLGDKPLAFETDMDESLPRVLCGDGARLRQVLLNLLSNAVKYTGEGFIKFSAAAEPAGEGFVKLIFSVRDSGIGIKGDDLSKLFMDFIRIDRYRNVNIEGSGLGLSIARGICRAMGGDITAESVYGQGSVFTASVLQKVVDASPMGVPGFFGAASADAASANAAPGFRAPGFRVLVVDDNEMNLVVARGLFAPYEVEADLCLSGEEALVMLGVKKYDLVFLDHMMPGLDGLETAAAIRALGGDFRLLPLVAFTANAVAGMREIFLEKGFSDYLSKPIEAEQLRRLMERFVPAGRRA